MTDEMPRQRPDDGAPEPVHPATRPKRSRPPWRGIALVVGGGAAIAATASIVTLAATHNSAAAENARAYLEGFADGFDASELDLFDDDPSDY